MRTQALFSSPKGRVVGKVLLVLVGLFLGLGCAELVLRIVGYEGDHERTKTVYHDELGQLLKDAWVLNAVFDPRLSDDVDVNGQHVAFKKTEGHTRIVFIGDSGTWGSGVERYEAFPIVFGTLARFFGLQELEVVNAAVAGMSNVTEYRFLEGQLTALQPDIVVLGLFMANDINWNLDDRRLLSEVPSPWTALGLRLKEHSALAHFASLQLLVLGSKFNFLRGADDALAEGSPVSSLDNAGLDIFNYTEGEVSTYKKQYSPLIEYAFDFLKEILWRSKTLGEKEGFQFAVVLLPTSSQIAGRLQIFTAPEALEEIRANGVDIRDDELDVEKPLRVVQGICRELEIVCIDPTLDLRRLGARWAIPDEDDHLTREGHQILATTLARHFDNQARRFVD